MIFKVGDIYKCGDQKREVIHILLENIAYAAVDSDKTEHFRIIWRVPAQGFYPAGNLRTPVPSHEWMDWVRHAERLPDA